MEKVLFLGGLIPRDEEIVANTINFMNNAADAFQLQFLDGIGQNGYRPVVVSAPFIGPFPKSYKKLFYKAKTYPDGHRYVSFFNLWGIRNFFRTRSLIRELKKPEYQDIEKMIVYSVHTPFSKAARYFKKKHPQCKLCLVVPDLPEYMNLRKKKSFLYRMTKGRDCKAFYDLTPIYDCFCLVTAHQGERVNKQKRPQTVVEAIAERIETAYIPLTHERKKIVYTGSLNKQFGILNLIEAVRGMQEPVELILCGSGDALHEVEALADERIRYLGVLDHDAVRAVQLDADVLVNPRTSEGEYTKYSFPGKTLEYLGTGRPVVCYKLGGTPDEYDSHLIYAKEETVEALREAIRAALALDEGACRRIFEENTAFLRESKTAGAMLGKLFSLFDSL